MSEKLDLNPWEPTMYGTNGLLISCRSCGREMEETVDGEYNPIEYEHEKYDRKCRHCLKIDRA